jgi:hypothetical protein
MSKPKRPYEHPSQLLRTRGFSLPQIAHVGRHAYLNNSQLLCRNLVYDSALVLTDRPNSLQRNCDELLTSWAE